MKKSMIFAAMLALAATGANAKTAADSAAIAKNKPVFTVVKENPITSIKDQNRSGTCWAYSTLIYFVKVLQSQNIICMNKLLSYLSFQYQI